MLFLTQLEDLFSTFKNIKTKGGKRTEGSLHSHKAYQYYPFLLQSRLCILQIRDSHQYCNAIGINYRLTLMGKITTVERTLYD